MATDINTLVKGAVDAGINEAFRRAGQDWIAQAQAVASIFGKTLTSDQLQALIKGGYTPDTFLGSELQIAVQLTLDATQEIDFGATGGVSIGPVQIQGNYLQKKASGEQANVSINITMVRQSRNDGLNYVLQQLIGPDVPKVLVPPVTPTPAPPAPPLAATPAAGVLGQATKPAGS